MEQERIKERNEKKMKRKKLLSLKSIYEWISLEIQDGKR